MNLFDAEIVSLRFMPMTVLTVAIRGIIFTSRIAWIIIVVLRVNSVMRQRQIRADTRRTSVYERGIRPSACTVFIVTIAIIASDVYLFAISRIVFLTSNTPKKNTKPSFQRFSHT